jgi:preprotein translocase subunit SecE
MNYKLNYVEVDFEVHRTRWGAEREVIQNFLLMI